MCVSVCLSSQHKNKNTRLLTGQALADGLDNDIVLNVIGVVGLQLSSNTSEGSLEGLLGGSVDHLGLCAAVRSARVVRSGADIAVGRYLNTGFIGGPSDEGDLVSGIKSAVCAPRPLGES